MSNDWQYLNPYGVQQQGSPVTGGGGSSQVLAGYRSIIDAKRSMATGRTPQAEYPDGYLGNVSSRREDRLLQHVQSRLTQRSYQRGVHKGERIDPSDYYWTPEVNPDAALEAQARGEKWTQRGSSVAEQINHLGKNHLLGPTEMNRIANGVGVATPQIASSERRAKMARLLPSWR